MRIASITKPITAVAILLLMEDDKLKLDDPVIDYLVRDKKFELPKDADSAWSRVTVRHLLQHSGGWDREKSKDPMFELLEITRICRRPLVFRTLFGTSRRDRWILNQEANMSTQTLAIVCLVE